MQTFPINRTSIHLARLSKLPQSFDVDLFGSFHDLAFGCVRIDLLNPLQSRFYFWTRQPGNDIRRKSGLFGYFNYLKRSFILSWRVPLTSCWPRSAHSRVIGLNLSRTLRLDKWFSSKCIVSRLIVKLNLFSCFLIFADDLVFAFKNKVWRGLSLCAEIS
jgi:hypothetical protein